MKGAWKCDGAIEAGLHSRGFTIVAGVDEVGRGCIFGAVVAAAVVLDPSKPIRGLNDSKQIEPDRRECSPTSSASERWSGRSPRSTACHRPHQHIPSVAPRHEAGPSAEWRRLDFVLVDAVPLDLDLPQLPLIQGDERCHSIAAASIVAKVHRDQTMREWDSVYPQYGSAQPQGLSDAGTPGRPPPTRPVPAPPVQL